MADSHLIPSPADNAACTSSEHDSPGVILNLYSALQSLQLRQPTTLVGSGFWQRKDILLQNMQRNPLLLVFFFSPLGSSFMSEFLPYLWYGFLTNGVPKNVLLPVVLLWVDSFCCSAAVALRVRIGPIFVILELARILMQCLMEIIRVSKLNFKLVYLCDVSASPVPPSICVQKNQSMHRWTKQVPMLQLSDCS